MMTMGADMADSLPALRHDLSRNGSNKSKPVLVLPSQLDRQWSYPLRTALSPPPVPKTPQVQHRKSHLRLRSDSGLALHTNQAAFRQYTDYNPDGSVPTQSSRRRTLSVDANSSVEDFAFAHAPSTDLRGFIDHGRTLPDFFEPAVIGLAFSSPATGRRLRSFAESRGGGADIEFLLKVEEHSRTLGDVISSMSYISSNFTSMTATSPLAFPPEVAGLLKSNTKYCARTALPALDKLYQDAKSAVEERLSQSLYPEFVKHQLALRLTAALSANRSVAGESETPYPGLGDAFCLADPLQPDNPVISASDGLLTMSGYRREELVGKNCRLLQGVATDPNAARRLSQAVSSGTEITELIINYRPDGTPYWNFLLICPLMENGGVRYFLGAQVNVSETMGAEHKDILGVLNFGRPPEESHPAQTPTPPAPAVWPARQSSDNPNTEQRRDDQECENGTSRRQRFFRRFRRKSPSSQISSPSRPRTSPEPTTNGSPTSSFLHRCYTTPLSPTLNTHQQRLNEHSTPYSRFFVMRYSPAPPPKQQQPHRCRRPLRTEQAAKRPTHDRDQDQTRGKDRDRDRDRESQQRTLPIAFCSSSALALLGLRAHESRALVDRDVFASLSSHLGSPSVNRALRANVMSKIAAGEIVTVDLMAPPAESPAVGAAAASNSGGVGGGAGGGGGGGSGQDSAASGSGESVGEVRPRLSGTLDRGAEFFSQVLFGSGQGKLRRVVSRWVPLKDGDGRVQWVVLVLTPVDGSPSA